MDTIFCVEDDANIRELIIYTLNATGFKTVGFESSEPFLEHIRVERPSLILLDIMLPGMDGLKTLEVLKSRGIDVPVILVTAKSDQIDKIKGLDSGADDYITKPFDIMELISRVKAVLRRSAKHNNSVVFTYKSLLLNHDSRRVTVAGEDIPLTFKEYELLHMLLVNQGTVLTRDRLMSEVWGTDFEGETRTVDVHIGTLRQKLKSAGEYIETVRNVGYKID